MFRHKYLKIEFLFFYVILVFNLVNIWSVDIYATLDGPAHLYNSGLLKYIGKSEFIKEYYERNEFFISNYLPHIILGKLFLFFDPFTSEKIFLSSIVVFLPLSFKYAVKTLSGNENGYSFLILLIVFTFLFHMGFFNFSFAFIFLNCQLIFWNWFLINKRKWLSITLFVISNLALYYTHPFVFIASMGVVFLYTAINYRLNIKELAKKLGVLSLLSLPALAFLILFMVKVNVPGANDTLKDKTNYEKIFELTHFTPAVSYGDHKELVYSTLVALLITFLISFIIVKRFLSGKTNAEFYSIDAFLISAIIVVFSIFFTHNASLGGMLNNRLSFLFFYFIIFWISCNKIDSKVILFISLIVASLLYFNASLVRHDVLLSLSNKAKSIRSVASAIKDKSLVYAVDYNGGWLEGHSADYAAINKEVVITENYEAICGWFPLKWKSKIFNVKCEIDSNNKSIILPDYVLIFGNQSKIDAPENSNFKHFIESKTTKCFESQDKFCCLFRVNK